MILRDERRRLVLNGILYFSTANAIPYIRSKLRILPDAPGIIRVLGWYLYYMYHVTMEQTRASFHPKPWSTWGSSTFVFSRLHPTYLAVLVMSQLQQCRLGASLLIPLIGMVTGALGWNSAATFMFNTAALVPLGSWINRSVDSLSVDGIKVVNELLKSTLGNSVELMVSSEFLSGNELMLIQYCY